MTPMSYPFSREDLGLLTGDDFRAAMEDDAFVDTIVYLVAQADGGSTSSIQFGAGIPAVIAALRRLAAESDADRTRAGQATSLATKLVKWVSLQP